MAIEGSQVAVIHNLRFGYKDIADFNDRDIVALMDYNLPHDVMSLCFAEIGRRRYKNLGERQTHEQT